MRTASTRFAILGLLSLEPMSGYDIRRASSDALSHFWHESYGQIYPTLAALARERLIRESPRASTQPGARATRRVYAITAAGRRALAAWQKRPPRERPFRSELLLRLFFGDTRSTPTLLTHVARLKAEETARGASYRALDQRLVAEGAGSPSLPYWRATLRYGQLRSEAALRWCDETALAFSALPRRKPRVRP